MITAIPNTLGIAEFLGELRDSGLSLWVEGGELCYSAPEGWMSPAVRRVLIERKAELVAYLSEGRAEQEEAKPGGGEGEAGYVAPRTAVEAKLAEIWAKVLGLERVGVEDNFFELGGDSVNSLQIIVRAGEAGYRVEVWQLLERQTVGELAQAIEGEGEEREAVVLGPAKREGKLTLSYAQQRLWFLDQLEPGNAAYNIIGLVGLWGELDVQAWEEGLNRVIQRHEVLRTVFLAEDGQPYQEIQASLRVGLTEVDLEGLSEEEQRGEVEGIVRAEGVRSFELSRGPLIRGILMRVGEGRHIQLVNVHHIVADGWSMGVLYREWGIAYSREVSGEGEILPELGIQYADYAAWQREWLGGEGQREQMEYWRRQLEGVSVLELPLDRALPAVQTFGGASQTFWVGEATVEMLKVLSRRERVTLYMTLLAAFKVVLGWYTGQTDIVVGTPVANRNRAELEQLIGFFVNTLALRTEVGGNPSFEELVRQVRGVALGAYSHQDVPFEQLVEELRPERDLSRTPLFQVMFAYQNVPRVSGEASGLVMQPMGVRSETAKFELTLTMWEGEGSLGGEVEYNTDLFEASTIERLVRHFGLVMERAGRHPEWRLSELMQLSEEERHQTLEGWNATEAEYPRDKCVHELVEAQVERVGERVAVVYGEEHVTYEELNRRANQLGHYLREKGVGPEVLVGICLERRVEMVIGLLAILKAGGAYVPLDPDYPPERLAFMLEDARMPIVLTQQHLIERLPELAGRTICLDAELEWFAGDDRGGENLACQVWPDNLLYVIYTSGSTGRPKGVQISHSALVNLLKSVQFEPGLTEQDKLYAVTSLSFDIAALELYLPLITGACLCVADWETSASGECLGQALGFSKASMLQATPTLWRLLVEADWTSGGALGGLCGGEVMPRELAGQLLESGVSLWNVYGPTETTVWSTLYHVDAVLGSVPIGRPLSNTQIYLLDPCMNPAPIGVAGELYIGGTGLSRGYLKRPELTAERFVPSPYSHELGARMYRTGDLARYLPDGNIEFIGRVDYQVKVRGFRIELGEIEAALEQHPGVRGAIVLAREDGTGQKQLVAYIVPQAEQSPTVGELRDFASGKLPNYMIPSVYVTMETLPLTPSGKVDRRALPAPEHGWLQSKNPFVAPRTPTESRLAEIWGQVLGLEAVGIYDNFFELGGHSLLATRVVSRIRAAFQIELPLRALFEASNIASLAEVVVQSQAEWQGGEMMIARLDDQAYAEDMLARLGELADEEMDLLLGKLLMDGEKL